MRLQCFLRGGRRTRRRPGDCDSVNVEFFKSEVMDSLPVLCAHAFDASADTNINHTGLNLVGDVNTGLETRRALPVQRANGSSLGQACDERSGAHLSSATTGGEHSSDGNILDESRVDLGSFEDGLEDTSHEVLGRGVLKATLSTLGEGAAAACCDDDLWEFLSAKIANMQAVVRPYIIGVLLEDLVATAGSRIARKLASNLRDSFDGYKLC